ncbi:hypothetical protein HUW62_07080 [Myxococcus sp. AM011]|uniref:hypothetical protein n=1 Tax=Myxococcus sp. AM011 TaxID=2745200 RepID=UPI0015959ABA|nr:hypothetical protein [Myxococcus sp. AM011]NVJ20976.1 hypothetical protein [Myxococcus sp. AM011]
MGTHGDAPATPDMVALVGCAHRMAEQAGGADVTDDELYQVIDRVLFGEKDGWACALEGLLTRTETANLILAHLESWLMDRTGRSWDSPISLGGGSLVTQVERALFGAR